MTHHVVFEPHADDAFLSLGGHIERWIADGDRVQIVTVYSGTRKRGRDAQSYAEAVGAEWGGAGIEEGGSKNPHRLFQGVFRGFQHPGALHYGPLGFAHPEHDEVRKFLAWDLDAPLLLYLDQPYAMTQKNSEAATQAMVGLEVVSYFRPPARKYRHCPLFRDQSLFFRYNPPEKLKNTFEMILRRPKR